MCSSFYLNSFVLRKLSGYLRQEGILKSGIVFTAHTYRSREDNCAEKLVAVSSPAGPRLDCGAQEMPAQSFPREPCSRGAAGVRRLLAVI